MAAKADENIIDDPTYPKYKIGGWIAKAGSWSIGLRPIPSSGVGKIKLNGFDVWIKKRKNPIIIICWKIKVKSLYLIGWFLVFKKKIKINKVNTNSHNSKLPSWFPHVPAIL